VAVVLFLVYGTLGAGLMLTNAYFVHGLELPWTWYWALWTALFAPAVIATLLASIWTAPWPCVCSFAPSSGSSKELQKEMSDRQRGGALGRLSGTNPASIRDVANCRSSDTAAARTRGRRACR
jgi:hypothetical protein